MREPAFLTFATLGVALAVNLGSARADVITAIDNTANGSNALSQNWKSISARNWNFLSFTVGQSDATISSMRMALFSSISESYDLTWELYAVDSSHNPSGVALATDTQTQSLSAGSSNVAYYEYTTGGSLASYTMMAGQTYGLLFKSNNASATLTWTRTAANHQYETGSSGFAFGQVQRTTNAGGSYNGLSPESFALAWQMNVNTEPSSVVPGAGGMAAIAGFGLLGRRRRR